MNKSVAAHELGKKIFQDPWLAGEIKNAEAVLRSNGEAGLRLAAREILNDDHFMMNWYPQLVKMAGSDAEAKNLFRPLLDGYVSALITSLPENASQTFRIAAKV
jgi:hypothetical protein